MPQLPTGSGDAAICDNVAKLISINDWSLKCAFICLDCASATLVLERQRNLLVFCFFYLKIGKPVQTQWSGWGELTSLFYWTVKYGVPLKTSTPCSTPPFRIKLQNSITDPPQYPVKHGLVSDKYRCVIRVSECSQSINSCDNKMVCNQFLASCFIYLFISKKTFFNGFKQCKSWLMSPQNFLWTEYLHKLKIWLPQRMTW